MLPVQNMKIDLFLLSCLAVSFSLALSYCRTVRANSIPEQSAVLSINFVQRHGFTIFELFTSNSGSIYSDIVAHVDSGESVHLMQ